VDDLDVIERQLGRPARGVVGVAARCPHGRPAVVEQASYLEDGTPFPTTFYLTCPAAVERLSRLESAGGVARYEALARDDAAVGQELRAGRRAQSRLRRPAPRMRDGGASLDLGIGGVAREGAVKCLHAHAAFALARPDYAFGRRVLAEVEPLFPVEGCCSA
jgi:uncharacterized protein